MLPAKSTIAHDEWDKLVGDCSHALKETEAKHAEALEYLKKAGGEAPRLKVRLEQFRAQLDKLFIFEVDGLNETFSEKLTQIKSKGFSVYMDQYIERIRTACGASSTSADAKQAAAESDDPAMASAAGADATDKDDEKLLTELFHKLVDEYDAAQQSGGAAGKEEKKNGGDAAKESEAGEKKVLVSNALKKRFPTQFALPHMTLDEFLLFVGGFWVTQKEIALTTVADVLAGAVVTKYAAWTIVKMTGAVEVDKDTGNARRPCILHSLPKKTESAEGNDTEIQEGVTRGYITVWDKAMGVPPTRPYGVPCLTSPMEMSKETVLTATGELGPKLDVLRRLKIGEKMDIMSLPVRVGDKMLRVKARAQSDKKLGWFTIHDSKSDTHYVKLE